MAEINQLRTQRDVEACSNHRRFCAHVSRSQESFGRDYNADAFAAKLQADANFVALVDRLDSLVRSLFVALKKKKDKTIKQAHNEFAEQFNEFRTRWEQLPVDYLMWRLGPMDLDFEALMKDDSPSQSVDTWNDDFEFDDEKESGASLVKDMVAYVSEHAETGGGVFNRMADAFQWFEARGLDLDVFERRWKTIPFTGSLAS